MTPRVLVMYATTHGQAGKVAAEIAKTMREAGASVSLADVTAPLAVDPGEYSAVIGVASVHAMGLQRAMRQWARTHRATLASRKTALVVVCLAAVNRTPKVERDLRLLLDRFSAATAWRPTETKIVAGALKYTKYNWLTRWVMKRIVAQHGGDLDTSRDYEYTDWEDVREFSRSFLESCARQEIDHLSTDLHGAHHGVSRRIERNARQVTGDAASLTTGQTAVSGRSDHRARR